MVSELWYLGISQKFSSAAKNKIQRHRLSSLFTTSMSTSRTSSSETILVSDSQNLLNLNMTNVTKLTSSNFLMWSRQVHALLDGYDLTGYIDGSVVSPSPTLNQDGEHISYIYYWKRQSRWMAYSIGWSKIPSIFT